MDEEVNPIKDYLFDYIKSSQTIPQLISDKKFDMVIDEIVEKCYDEIATMDERNIAVGVLATGQRKIEFRGVELDIVVPDIKTLEKDSKMSLIICIPKSSDKQIIAQKISQLEKIQPVKENIWVVLSENMDIDKRTFVLSKEDSSFSKIIFEIAQFSNVNGANKFKILRI
jgi:hypothetical protein